MKYDCVIVIIINCFVLFLEFPSNVAYQEYSLELDKFPIELRCFLPNIYYSNGNNIYCDSIRESNYLRIVALVATKDIECNSELLSTYYTIIHDISRNQQGKVSSDFSWQLSAHVAYCACYVFQKPNWFVFVTIILNKYNMSFTIFINYKSPIKRKSL